MRHELRRVRTIRSMVLPFISADSAPTPRNGWMTNTASEKNRKMMREIIMPASSDEAAPAAVSRIMASKPCRVRNTITKVLARKSLPQFLDQHRRQAVGEIVGVREGGGGRRRRQRRRRGFGDGSFGGHDWGGWKGGRQRGGRGRTQFDWGGG